MPHFKPIVRTYRYTDAEILQKADFIAMMVARDAEEFATRNISDTDALEAARAAFDEFPTDLEFLGTAMEAGDARDAALAAIKDDIVALRNMAALAFKNRPAVYKTFGFDRFAALGDNDAYRAARLMHAIATLHKPALAPKGLTDDWLDAFKAHIAAFDQSMDALRLAEAVRVQKTEDRIILGNALHAELSDLAMVGQSLFVNTNEAKYNDYVMDAGSA